MMVRDCLLYTSSPTVKEESGFSAGSFRDLTRVAKLNEDMWTELFLMNQPALLYEIDTIMAALAEYRDALADGDRKRIRLLFLILLAYRTTERGVGRDRNRFATRGYRIIG